MTKKTYAVMGATGNIGKNLVKLLLKNGHEVHSIARDQKTLMNLKDKGSKIFTVDTFENASALTKAFENCDAIFSLIPPAYQENNFEMYQDKVGEAIKQALINCGISYVLNISSIGAQLSQGTGPIKGLHRHEERLNTIPNLNVLHLRPGYFMENLYWSIPLLKNHGILGTAVRPDIPIAMVACSDISAKAAEFLEKLNFKGHTIFELLGPKEVTMNEAAKAIGKAIKHPDLHYRQFPYDEAQKGMLDAGMRLNSANLLIEMYKSVNDQKIVLTQNITPEHRGKTTIEEFAQNCFAPALMAEKSH